MDCDFSPNKDSIGINPIRIFEVQPWVVWDAHRLTQGRTSMPSVTSLWVTQWCLTARRWPKSPTWPAWPSRPTSTTATRLKSSPNFFQFRWFHSWKFDFLEGLVSWVFFLKTHLGGRISRYLPCSATWNFPVKVSSFETPVTDVGVCEVSTWRLSQWMKSSVRPLRMAP